MSSFSTGPTFRQGGRLDRDASDLHSAVSELMRVYQFRNRERVSGHDLSVTQFRALEEITAADGMSMNELAARMFLDKSTTSRVVDALERKGIAARQPNPTDRRAVSLVPTENGKEVLKTVRDELIAEDKRLLADFEPAVRREMTRLIIRLSEAAAARVDTTGGTCNTID